VITLDAYSGLYLLVLATALVTYLLRRRRAQAGHAAELQASIESGMAEPPSLHPVVDPALCIGSGSCVKACPEEALGIVAGKAVLKNAAACIGHGACHAACPMQAIQLVFGTERRGIDIPNVTPEFESNVPGIFIAGELGGMGLIRKATEQGRQAIEALRKRSGGDWAHDVLIVGCGPAGLSAALSALQHRLRYKLIEQEDSLGGTVYHYPRHKIAMTAPVQLALVGKVRFGEVQKEELLAFWNDVVKKTGVQISFREQLEAIERQGDGFLVRTNRGTHATRSVLLAMGRRGTPRKLEVPGEEAAKVVYRLVDAAQYTGQAVLVVGGGDSALEAAVAVAEQPGTEVTLSYRGASFTRVKQRNRDALDNARRAGRLQLLLESQVRSIEAGTVLVEHGGTLHALRNDAVIVCAGGSLPTPLLQRAGILFETKHGTA
jgi:thioredoxin reductase (NADPH)